MHEHRRYSLLENTFLFSYLLSYTRMSEAIKTFQTLDTNSKNLANYPKGEPAVCFEKMHVYLYKVSYCENGEMKDNFQAA